MKRKKVVVPNSKEFKFNFMNYDWIPFQIHHILTIFNGWNHLGFGLFPFKSLLLKKLLKIIWCLNINALIFLNVTTNKNLEILLKQDGFISGSDVKGSY
jgi:hypothetical protein